MPIPLQYISMRHNCLYSEYWLTNYILLNLTLIRSGIVNKSYRLNRTDISRAEREKKVGSKIDNLFFFVESWLLILYRRKYC